MNILNISQPFDLTRHLPVVNPLSKSYYWSYWNLILDPKIVDPFSNQYILNCLDGSGRTCTYLPGIKIDDSVIDRNKLQPTGANITSQFGDVISPASIAAIREPGFQGGADGATGSPGFMGEK